VTKKCSIKSFRTDFTFKFLVNPEVILKLESSIDLSMAKTSERTSSKPLAPSNCRCFSMVGIVSRSRRDVIKNWKVIIDNKPELRNGKH
jgi:hypothetical protein